MKARTPAGVLVVQTGFLGDVVLATPVLAELKRQWPMARITVLVRPEAAPLLRGHPYVDAVWTDDKRGRERGPRGLWRVAGRLRRGGFDCAVGLHKSLRTALLLALARIPLRVGFRQSAGWFLYHRRAALPASAHAAQRQLALLGALDFDCDGLARPLLVADPQARLELRRLLSAAGLAAGREYVALAPGSAWATKRWIAEGYAQVASAVRASGEEVVFVGAPSESASIEDVRRRAGGGISLAGVTDTAVLVAAIEGAQALVCNDSAPMHIAQALSVPVVAIFGPTSPQMGFGPRFEPAVVVEESLDCRPCSRHGGRHCPLGTHACMKGIAPQRVLAALAEVRQQAPAPVGLGEGRTP